LLAFSQFQFQTPPPSAKIDPYERKGVLAIVDAGNSFLFLPGIVIGENTAIQSNMSGIQTQVPQMFHSNCIAQFDENIAESDENIVNPSKQLHALKSVPSPVE
jgi:hypothetical protein